MKVAVVKFEKTNKQYYFDINNLELKAKQAVVVNTIRGLEIGLVSGIKEIAEEELVAELKPIERIATEDDLKTNLENEKLVEEIVLTTKDLVVKNQLEMKVIDAEYTLDQKKLIIYFEADNKVDFRNLVKDLSSVYKTRIELRQVGARDSAKIIGGVGPCGLVLCCNTFIGEFDAVTIKMAKNQDISLNPTKISGSCGVLLCCIKYEDALYSELRENAPKKGSIVKYKDKEYKVIDENLLNQQVKISYQNDAIEILWVDNKEVVVKWKWRHKSVLIIKKQVFI